MVFWRSRYTFVLIRNACDLRRGPTSLQTCRGKASLRKGKEGICSSTALCLSPWNGNGITLLSCLQISWLCVGDSYSLRMPLVCVSLALHCLEFSNKRSWLCGVANSVMNRTNGTFAEIETTQGTGFMGLEKATTRQSSTRKRWGGPTLWIRGTGEVAPPLGWVQELASMNHLEQEAHFNYTEKSNLKVCQNNHRLPLIHTLFCTSSRSATTN